MGTSYHITVADDAAAAGEKSLKQGVDSLLTEINRQMSTYIPQSEISRFNRWPKDTPFRVSADFMKVLQLSLQIYRESHGAFDVTVGPLVDLWGFGKKGARQSPPDAQKINSIRKVIGSGHVHILSDSTISKDVANLELDFSAVAKGYGVDAVADLLKKQGLYNFLVEIGGEVVTSGSKRGALWKIGIDRPELDAAPGHELEEVLHLSDAAMATSGDYRNYFVSGDSLYSHEINPGTGRPVTNKVASVTVIAPSCALADAMATAIMVMGKKTGMQWLNSEPQVEGLIILRTKDGFKEAMSSNFGAYLSHK